MGSAQAAVAKEHVPLPLRSPFRAHERHRPALEEPVRDTRPGLALVVETLGDVVWETLFSSGTLAENPDIRLSIARQQRFKVLLEEADQLGTTRPANVLGDVGALEIP